jgi:hypothetical protein
MTAAEMDAHMQVFRHTESLTAAQLPVAVRLRDSLRMRRCRAKGDDAQTRLGDDIVKLNTLLGKWSQPGLAASVSAASEDFVDALRAVGAGVQRAAAAFNDMKRTAKVAIGLVGDQHEGAAFLA